MRLRNVRNAKDRLNSCELFVSNPENFKGQWATIFQNENPIHLEIGMGKGDFLIEMARRFPEINFIGIEKYESVLVRAIEKIHDEELPNIRFLCFDASNLEDIFGKEIQTLYLNFSDPWPKKRHAKRRLTHHNFLKIYEAIFCEEKIIIQKTDNAQLFAFSLEELSKFGYVLEKVSLDLHQEPIFNIPTEYENKFSNLGFPIHYVEARKKLLFFFFFDILV